MTGAGEREAPGEPEVIADHGGRVAAATAAYGCPAEGWLDLSTGINPRPYPVPEVAPEVWARLPDEDLFQAARHAARGYYGIGAAAGIVEAAGSQALIQALPRVLPRCRVGVLGFTYAEHERCWRAAGHDVVAVDDIDSLAGSSVVVLANPNNPDGQIHQPRSLAALADKLAAAGGLLVVDEAFADVAPELSLAPLAGGPGLCLLRSFGKFFGLAGLRLGHALAEPALALRLEAHLGPWRASGPALAVAARALADQAWIAATRRELAAAAARLDRLLNSAGLSILGGTHLFRLTESEDAARLHDALARRGILTRRFAARPRWLRFGLPPDETGWQRLARGLAEARAGERVRTPGRSGARPRSGPPGGWR